MCFCMDPRASMDTGCVMEAGFGAEESRTPDLECALPTVDVGSVCDTCPTSCASSGGVCITAATEACPWACCCPHDTWFEAGTGCVPCTGPPELPCGTCGPCVPPGGVCSRSGCVCGLGWDVATACATCASGWLRHDHTCVPCQGQGAMCGHGGTCVAGPNWPTDPTSTTCMCKDTHVNVCDRVNSDSNPNANQGPCCVACADPGGAFGVQTVCSTCEPGCGQDQWCVPGNPAVCACLPGFQETNYVGPDGGILCAPIPPALPSSRVVVGIVNDATVSMVFVIDALLWVLFVLCAVGCALFILTLSNGAVL